MLHGFRVQVVLPLLWIHSAQIAKCSCHNPPPIRLQSAQLCHRSTNLLPLLRIQILHLLRALKNVRPLLCRQRIELRQPIPHPLLGLRRKLPEPRLILKRPLLLLRRLVLMSGHPLWQVLLAASALSRKTSARARSRRPRRLWHRPGRLTPPIAEGRSTWQHQSRQGQRCRTAGCKNAPHSISNPIPPSYFHRKVIEVAQFRCNAEILWFVIPKESNFQPLRLGTYFLTLRLRSRTRITIRVVLQQLVHLLDRLRILIQNLQIIHRRRSLYLRRLLMEHLKPCKRPATNQHR